MGPFEGVRVLDIGHVLAGPLAATLLGDLGADVIKVEQPQGDNLRELGPKKDGHGIWWKVAARNKRCITLDLRKQEGQALLLELVKHADVLVENFRPGRLEDWNIGWDRLSEVNPKLVMLRISGFGQGTSYGSRPMFGRPAEAMSGLVGMTGFPDGPPVHAGFSLGDAMTSVMGAFGVASALFRRSVTGLGEQVDLALFETPFRLMDWLLPIYDQLGIVSQRSGNQFPLGLMVGNVYRSADGRWMSTSAATENVVHSLLRTIGGEELVNDQRFADPSQRQVPENHATLLGLIGEWIAERPSVEVIRAFEEAGAVISPVFDIEDIVDEPIYTEREMLVEVDDANLGPFRMPGVIPKFTRSPSEVRWTGMDIGAHNEEVYGDLLGLRTEEIDKLRADAVI